MNVKKNIPQTCLMMAILPSYTISLRKSMFLNLTLNFMKGILQSSTQYQKSIPLRKSILQDLINQKNILPDVRYRTAVTQNLGTAPAVKLVRKNTEIGPTTHATTTVTAPRGILIVN